jgi:predicted aspartyl protease
MYVKIRVNDREIVVMLDSGATNTFVADGLVTQLGLCLSNSQTSMKAVNAKAQRILGMAHGVPVVLDNCQGK